MQSRTKSGRRVPSKPFLSPRGERLLEELEDIFLREGFRKITVGELAGRLHCSRQTLYQLASSKDALVLLVLDRCLSRIRRTGTEAATARRDVREKIIALIEPGVTEMRSTSRAFLADIASVPATRRLLQQHQVARRQEAESIIRSGIRARAFRNFDSRLAAEAILAALQRVMDPEFLADVSLSPADAIRQTGQMLLGGLLQPNGRGKTRVLPARENGGRKRPTPAAKAQSRGKRRV